MLVKFENLTTKEVITENLTNGELNKICSRDLITVNGDIYVKYNVIKFSSHINVLIKPLYQWECALTGTSDNFFSTFDNKDRHKFQDIVLVYLDNDDTEISDPVFGIRYWELPDGLNSLPEVGSIIIKSDSMQYLVNRFEIQKAIYHNDECQLRRIIRVSEVITNTEYSGPIQ